MRLPTDRRQFLRSLLAGSFALSSYSFNNRTTKPKLAFATLGCPDWSYGQVIDFASKYGYDGIEFRGLKRQFDLTKTETFGSERNIREALWCAKDKNIKIVCLGSSAVLHYSDTVQRKKNMDEAKRFIDLAFKLECRYVRVFGDRFIHGKEKTLDLITEGMRELSQYANSSDIEVLLSTHGDVSTADALCDIMKNVSEKNAGVSWDILNSWYYNHEHPSLVYKKIKPYMKLVHLQDMSFERGKEKIAFVGKGDVPLFEGVKALMDDGFDGYLSFVWEKHWNAEIEEPEIAFAEYIKVMKQYLLNHN